jgi:hypothetical protein
VQAAVVVQQYLVLPAVLEDLVAVVQVERIPLAELQQQ